MRRTVIFVDDIGTVHRNFDNGHVLSICPGEDKFSKLTDTELSEKEEKMAANKFELFAGCLGNGITICNKATMKNGDYKQVAHISEGGNIRLSVNESYIPTKAMEKIKKLAENQKRGFQKRFESLPDIKQYEIILENVSYTKLLEYVHDKKPLSEKLPKMREYYYTIA